MQNNIPHIATNNSAMQQICNLGLNAYQLQSQPQLAYTSQNLQQHNVKNSNNLVASGKRKFVPEEVVSKGFDTCIQHPKQAKWNQDPIAASAFDFIAPPTNVDDINITSVFTIVENSKGSGDCKIFCMSVQNQWYPNLVLLA